MISKTNIKTFLIAPLRLMDKDSVSFEGYCSITKIALNSLSIMLCAITLGLSVWIGKRLTIEKPQPKEQVIVLNSSLKEPLLIAMQRMAMCSKLGLKGIKQEEASDLTAKVNRIIRFTDHLMKQDMMSDWVLKEELAHAESTIECLRPFGSAQTLKNHIEKAVTLLRRQLTMSS